MVVTLHLLFDSDRRTDNVEVWVGFGMPTQTLAPIADFKTSHAYTHGIAEESEEINVPCDIVGSVVSLYLHNTIQLNICEVEVYGKMK